MLLYTAFMSAILALALAATLEGSLAFARASTHRAADRLAENGLGTARATLLAGLAAQAKGGAAPSAPPPLARAAACSGTPCPFYLDADFDLGGTTLDDGDPNRNATAENLQTHPAVAEQRLAARITAHVTAADGSLLAQRTELLTLRTTAVPPYVIVDGSSDGDGTRDGASEADAAGCDPGAAGSCDPGAPAPPADTRIHVERICTDGGTGACAAAGERVRFEDAFASTPWANRNAVAPSWSR